MCKIGGGITTIGVLCVLPKFSAPTCQNGSFAVSLRPLICICEKPLQGTANIRIYADIPPSIVVIEPFRPTNCQIPVHAEILVLMIYRILVYDIF